MSYGAANAVFNALDTNQDGVLDRSELGGAVGVGYGAGYGVGYGAGYGSGLSGYESYSSSGYGAGAGLVGAGYGGSSYDSFSYGSGGYGLGLGAGYGASSYDSSLGYGAGAVYGGSVGVVDAGYSGVSSGAVYATDSQGLYQDPNPQIITRAAPGGVQTYTQNIRVRFLQPPPVPPPGPLIIREVRPPQPPVPPPLRLRQQAPPLPTPPPLVLRERPPVPPLPIASQTVIRRLPGLPVPPRSVIIERFPPLPPRPRDVVIERWVPYGAQAKRRTILQRAGAAVQYARPRNVIIQYQQTPARIVRQFQRLGVTSASPAAYVQQYGASLLDASTLVSQARAAGVVEDISAPGFVGGAVGYGAATYGQDVGLHYGHAHGLGLGLGGAGYESSSYSSYGGDLGLVGGAGYGASYGVGYGAGYGVGLDAGYGGYGSSSSYESSSYGGGYGGYGYGASGAAFGSLDANADGVIDRAEFDQLF